MAILLQPPVELLPAYRPIAFQVALTALPSGFVGENANVTIYRDGVNVVGPIPYKSFGNAPNVVPGFTDYFFNIDIQKFCQDLLAPFPEIPTIFPRPSELYALNKEFYGEFFIEITYDYIDPVTGLLTPFPFLIDTSNTYFVFAASRQNQELMSLEDYLGSGPTVSDRKFLTKSARTLDICPNESGFLTVIQASNPFPTNGVLAIFYDSSGAVIDFGLAFLPSALFAGQTTLNIGLESLSYILWVDGSPTLPNPLIDSYSITFGFITVSGGPVYSFLAQTETFTYNVKPNCCDRRSLRLHWMNLLGGADSYTFDEDKDFQITTTNDKGQKSLNWDIGSLSPNPVSDSGNLKLKSEASRAYNLNSKILTNEKALWLSELLFSTKVFAEINGEFIPVLIEEKVQSITRDEGKIRFPIVATLARDLIIQRQ